MEELKLTGNHLKGSLPLLTFSSNFDKDAHWKLLNEMITQIFGIPKKHRKSKPYHDHLFVFSIIDDDIWFQNYQVGPRFCLNPIKIFGGSFGVQHCMRIHFTYHQTRLEHWRNGKSLGNMLNKVNAKTRRKMLELSNPLKPYEFADMWEEWYF